MGCDIREGKRSICYAYALEGQKVSPEDRRKLIEIVGADRDDTTEDGIAWVIEFYRREGVLEFAQAEADRLAAESMAALDKLQVPEAGKNDFRDVIRFVVDRKV